VLMALIVRRSAASTRDSVVLSGLGATLDRPRSVCHTWQSVEKPPPQRRDQPGTHSSAHSGRPESGAGLARPSDGRVHAVVGDC
jgi:hypothetical protein